MTEPQLIKSLYKALADTFLFYYLAHQCHWNVKGMHFDALHGFFGSLYEDAHGAVDDIAEHIRAMDELVPVGLSTLCAAADVEDLTKNPGDAGAMIDKLLAANGKVVMALDDACKGAESRNEYGLANFLQDRLDKHAKHFWMLKAHK